MGHQIQSDKHIWQAVRFTEDNHTASPTDTVYEIVYVYHNPEASGIPEPRKTLVSEIPLSAKIWTHRINCQKACNRIKKQDPEVIGPGRKILPL